MKKEPIKTHQIEFKKESDAHFKRQGAYGKTDLFNCIRAMMKDGYDEFKITTIKK